jgi:hypothetical protein
MGNVLGKVSFLYQSAYHYAVSFPAYHDALSGTGPLWTATRRFSAVKKHSSENHEIWSGYRASALQTWIGEKANDNDDGVYKLKAGLYGSYSPKVSGSNLDWLAENSYTALLWSSPMYPGNECQDTAFKYATTVSFKILTYSCLLLLVGWGWVPRYCGHFCLLYNTYSFVTSFLNVVDWCENEFTWYAGHYLAYCTSPR